MTTLVQFMATYDASGSEKDRDGTLVVAALAATEHKWKKFEREWNDVLDRFKVPYFHMKQLNHRHSGTGIYAKWKGDNETPQSFLMELIRVLLRGINKTFCYGTILLDYKDIDRTFKLREGAGSPYVLTAASCVDQVNNWMRRKYPKHPILHVFEEGDCGQRDFKRLARLHNQMIVPIPKINPETGYPWVHFQGADLVAGAYRNAANKLGKVTTFDDYGEVFTALAEKLPQKSLIHHKETLLSLCESNPDKCPRRA